MHPGGTLINVKSKKNVFLYLNDHKRQIPCEKALKYREAYSLVEIYSSLIWRLNITSLSSYIPSIRNLQHVKQAVLERKARLCHAPILWLAVETAQNILALDYSAWIIYTYFGGLFTNSLNATSRR